MKFFVVILWLMGVFTALNVAFECLTAANTIQNMVGVLIIATVAYASYKSWLGIKWVDAITEYNKGKKK